jgi:hypothetical protein
VYINLGKWSENEFNALLNESSGISDHGKRIAYLSGSFLGTDYQPLTLHGSSDRAEELVINFEGVDCFTFIDYIEAMRLSGSFPEFIENLKRVRYREGDASFDKRNHFFTDWPEYNADLIMDVTVEIGGKIFEKITKLLNKKDDGTLFVKGIAPVWRDISYIPAGNIDAVVISELNTGDYIGFYLNDSGIDVSHVGIIIKERGKVFLRHASSIHKKVIDEDLADCLRDKPGIIVLRARV